MGGGGGGGRGGEEETPDRRGPNRFHPLQWRLQLNLKVCEDSLSSCYVFNNHGTVSRTAKGEGGDE